MRQPRIREGFPGQRLVVIPSRIVTHAFYLPVCTLLMPTHIGRFNQARHHFVDRRQGTEQFVLIVCLAGTGACKLGSAKWQMEAGHAVILPPHMHHRYQADMERPWTIFWVHFTGSAAPDYFDALTNAMKEPRLWIDNLAAVTDAFEETYRYVLGGYTDVDLLGLSTSFARLLGLCRVHQKSLVPRRRLAEDRVLRSIRYMREHVEHPVSLEDCARSAGWSAAHFSLAFKRQINLSPIQFLTRLKMTRACELLKMTDLSMQEIAQKIGFQDQFYFSRLFRRHLRMAPTSYRREFSLPSID